MESTNQHENLQNSTMETDNMNPATSSQSILGKKVIFQRVFGCGLILKVSKSQKPLMVYLTKADLAQVGTFFPARISALASKMGQIKKIKTHCHAN